ncbi:transposase [Pectinatus cerevisiiphilus]|uniref:Transposase n=1 Tax=Pectinatus cerevisiiphilus TaxID=86956 RepID=A0A4R3KDY4_9FIRM|nr:transposase [Pectinatus cerevisiiphilus]TCS81417.1 transposase [Pectinatus cerevisiiphilus]
MKRNPHTPNEKAKLVLEVLKGERTLNEIASEHSIHPNMLSRWKNEAIAGLASVFENDAAQKRKEKKEHETEIDELYAQIGKLTTQNEWLKKKIWSVIFLRLQGNHWLIGLVQIFLLSSRPACCQLIELRYTTDTDYQIPMI